MIWFPSWSWFWHPSGAAVGPEHVTFWRRLIDAPILAHPGGMLIAVALCTAVVRLAIPAWVFQYVAAEWFVYVPSTGWGVLSQWWKNRHERYGAPWGATAWTEMTRRLALEQVALGLLILLLAQGFGWL